MEIWISQERGIVFKTGKDCYYIMTFSPLLYPCCRRKRRKLTERNLYLLSYFQTYTIFPPNFTVIYYTDKLNYFHELIRLVEIVCI